MLHPFTLYHSFCVTSLLYSTCGVFMSSCAFDPMCFMSKPLSPRFGWNPRKMVVLVWPWKMEDEEAIWVVLIPEPSRWAMGDFEWFWCRDNKWLSTESQGAEARNVARYLQRHGLRLPKLTTCARRLGIEMHKVGAHLVWLASHSSTLDCSNRLEVGSKPESPRQSVR